MKRYLYAAVLAFGMAMSIPTPAHADTGTMNLDEYIEHHPGETKSIVETVCDCTGHKLTEWTAAGDDYKLVAYTPNSGFPDTQGENTIMIQMQFRFWNGGWHVNDHQAHCNTSHCVIDYY